MDGFTSSTCATKEIGDVCTQARKNPAGENELEQ